MTDEQRLDIVAYRIETAQSFIPEIESHIQNGFYNTAMNRMYYACFSAASALLVFIRVDGVKTHEGVRHLFCKNFIAEKIFDKKWSKFYSDMSECRSAADYEDFVYYTEEDCNEMFPQAKEFILMIDEYIKSHPLPTSRMIGDFDD